MGNPGPYLEGGLDSTRGGRTWLEVCGGLFNVNTKTRAFGLGAWFPGLGRPPLLATTGCFDLTGDCIPALRALQNSQQKAYSGMGLSVAWSCTSAAALG